MGSSYVEFREKGFWSRDGTIELWERFLVLEIDKLTECPNWLQDFRMDLDIQATGATGVGCNLIGLDDYITTEERRQTLITLAHAALSTIEQYGEFIPKATLNAFPLHEGVRWLTDVNTASMKCFATYFLKLLNGEYLFTGSDWSVPIENLYIEQVYNKWSLLLPPMNSSS